jgi:hypothetical protein
MKRIDEILIFLLENTLESFDNAIHATEVLIFLRGNPTSFQILYVCPDSI